MRTSLFRWPFTHTMALTPPDLVTEVWGSPSGNAPVAEASAPWKEQLTSRHNIKKMLPPLPSAPVAAANTPPGGPAEATTPLIPSAATGSSRLDALKARFLRFEELFQRDLHPDPPVEVASPTSSLGDDFYSNDDYLIPTDVASVDAVANTEAVAPDTSSSGPGMTHGLLSLLPPMPTLDPATHPQAPVVPAPSEAIAAQGISCLHFGETARSQCAILTHRKHSTPVEFSSPF